MSELIKRRDAVQATIDHFRDAEFEYGSSDCARLVAYCLQQLGHPDYLEKFPKYTDAASAYRAMKRRHVRSFESHLDKLGFERIALSHAIAGDIVTIPSGDDRFPALGIHVGGNNIAAFAKGYLSIGPFIVALQAWRVTVVS